MTPNISDKKYYFKSSHQPGNWYGLISPSLDRLYLSSNEYQYLKILQLCVMRHELFYVVDLCQLRCDMFVDNTNCLEHTLSNARRLHLELDVEIKKLKDQSLIKKDVPPSEFDLELQNKLFLCYQIIKLLENTYGMYKEILISEWKQEIQGLELTKLFARDVFDDRDFHKITDRDLQEISFSVSELEEFRKKVLQILTFVDYSQPIYNLKQDLRKKIESIDLGKYALDVRKIQITNKKLDMDLCMRLISQNNYAVAQQILKEKLSSILLLLLQ